MDFFIFLKIFQKSEFGRFEKQEIKLFWPYRKLMIHEICVNFEVHIMYESNPRMPIPPPATPGHLT